MSRVSAKICGLKTPQAIDAALAGGAGWLGFVTFAKSPRHLTPDRIAPLAAHARAHGAAGLVSVLVDPDDALLDAVGAAFAPDAIQLHGHETPQRVAAVRARGVPVIKAFPVATRADLDATVPFRDVADMMLFDARPPAGAALPGGLGQGWDWSLMAGFDPGVPWFLSGGLAPETVAQAARQSGAARVDVSSGVESAPGVKDTALIAAFLAALPG